MSRFHRFQVLKTRGVGQYTEKNPWKSYPPYRPCFCGCGRKAKFCHAIKLMPMWITPNDAIEAKKEMTEMIHHVEALERKGEFFKDEERSRKMLKIFMERDKPDENPVIRKNADRSGVGSDPQASPPVGERDVGPSAIELSGQNSGVDENRPS